MKGDFSKWDNDPNDNFNGVLHQQGRFLLDSDWNAQTQILNHWQAIAGQDIIGAGVAAVPADRPDAFKVIHAKISSTPDRVELQVQPGRIWADGFSVNLAGKVPLTRQAQYLQPPIQNPSGTVGSIAAGVRDAVILEVWQEAVNGFQTPETLIEPALGGPDTTKRLQTAMAWRLYRLTEDEDCNNIRDKLQGDRNQHGKLTVSLQDPTVTSGDCPVVSSGGYTGFEHYLYRVEIAQVNGTIPKFKWSQLNGGLVGRGMFQAASGGQPGKVIITHNLQAIIHAGISDFYLEVVEYDPASGHQQVIYGATASLNNSNELELATTPTFGTQPVSGAVPTYFFRLWNGIADISNFTANPAKPLQDGILLKFEDPATGKVYQPEDYWTFKVRAGEIPNLSPLIDNQPPEGLIYHRVAVAELNWKGTEKISFDKQEIEDCRHPFRPLTNQKGCCTFSVGDGKRSQGDFNSIELAIRHLSPAGGKICLLPGLHQANVEIRDRQNIQISGCGIHTIVTPHPDPDRVNQPIFSIDASQNIQLDQMTLLHLTGTAIQVLDSANANRGSSEITIHHNRITASVHGIEVRVKNEIAGNNDIVITENLVAMLDLVEGKAAIFSIADRVKIACNRLVVVPAPIPDRPEDPRSPDTPVGVFDPCKDRKHYYTNRRLAIKLLQQSFLYATSLSIARKLGYLAQGGIQIGGGSERVKILDNEILGGSGHGITLGDIPEEAIDSLTLKQSYGLIATLSPAELKLLQGSFISHLYEIVIAENTIRDLGLSGIGVVAFFDLSTINLIVSVEDLTIYRNQITHCAHQLPPDIPKNMLSMCGFGGIALASCENTVIQENRIENNGIDRLQPICGIFILNSERVDISNNRILNNGIRTINVDSNLQPGWRGGIVIGMSFKQLISQISGDTQWLSPDGIPAAKIHDNTVTQPVGQALFLIASGPVSIVGNSLTSQGTDFKVNPFALLAGSVFILNLGFSRDLVGYLFLNSFKQIPPSKLATSPRANIGLLYLPSGTVLFANNQVSLDLRSPEINVAFSSQLIASLDDVAYTSNQTECNSFADVIFTDVALFGFTIRSNDNRFQEGITITSYSLFSYGNMNIAASNQSTHCLLVLGNPALTVLSPDNRVLFNPNSCNESRRFWQQSLNLLTN